MFAHTSPVMRGQGCWFRLRSKPPFGFVLITTKPEITFLTLHVSPLCCYISPSFTNITKTCFYLKMKVFYCSMTVFHAFHEEWKVSATSSVLQCLSSSTPTMKMDFDLSLSEILQSAFLILYFYSAISSLFSWSGPYLRPAASPFDPFVINLPTNYKNSTRFFFFFWKHCICSS